MTEQDRADEDILGKAYDSRLMRRLLRYLRPYRAQVAFAIVLLLFGAALELVGPYLTKIALDRAVPARDLHLIGLLALGYLGTLVIGFGLEFGQTVPSRVVIVGMNFLLRLVIRISCDFAWINRKFKRSSRACRPGCRHA